MSDESVPSAIDCAAMPRAPLALLAAALLCSSCVTAPTPPPKKVDEPIVPLDPCRLTAPMKVWLRGGEVLRSPGGPVAADVWNPIVAEASPDGRLRVPDPGGTLVEGWAPELKGSVEIEERGVGLYVQEEAPLHLEPNGPEIGRISPGVYLPVLAWDACFAKVLLRGFPRKLAGESAAGATPFIALVPTARLGTREIPLRPALPGRGRFVRDYRRDLLVEPGKPMTVFSEARCVRLRILEQARAAGGQPPVQRVALAERGIELRGWVDRPIVEVRGDERCPTRVLEKVDAVAFDGEATGLPDGYARAGDPEALAKAWADFAKKERTLYIPVPDGEGVRCRAFHLKPKHTELTRNEERNGRKVTLSWRVQAAGHRLTLTGPCRSKEGATCSIPYLLQALGPDRVALLPARDAAVARARTIVAYYADDAEAWFFGRRTCVAEGGVDRVSGLLQ